MTFWEHLDVLRGSIIRMSCVVLVFGMIAFVFKDELFSIVLAPKNSHFISYRLFNVEPFNIKLVNIGLTEQFMVHMKTAFFFGIIAASPYILYLLYHFISPALYRKEKRYTIRIISCGYIMFIIGLLTNYFIIFPLTVRFLGTYSVSTEVSNLLSLQSYIDTLLMTSLVFGILFEIPIISWLMAVMGIIKAEWMQKYRRHAIVTILIISAIITPTTDAFTLFIVFMPIWLLYELSILIVRITNTQK
nr:twin-arginine translocase subunit TatC [Prevotella sp.]